MKKTGFTLKASADPAVAVLRIDGVIGSSVWDANAVSSRDVAAALNTLSSEVRELRVPVNSPGGDAGDGLDIANQLREQHQTKGRKVTTYAEGLVASAASVILMGGQTVEIADNALVMIHRAWTLTAGDAGEHERAVAMLNKFDEALVVSYQWHSSLSAEELKRLMTEETWFNASEAVAAGLATSIISPSSDDEAEDVPVAAYASRVFAQLQDRAPVAVRRRLAALAKAHSVDAADVLREVQAAGCGLELAQALIDEGLPMVQVRRRIAAAQAQRVAAEVRASEIRGMCAASRMPKLAPTLIDSGLSVAQVGLHMTSVLHYADLSVGEIDGGLEEGLTRASRGQKLSYAEIYARINKRPGEAARS